MHPDISPKDNAIDHGTTSPQDLIVRAKKHYLGIYNRNHYPERRVSVEYVFRIIKLHPLTICYRTMTNKLKILHTFFSNTPFSSTFRSSGGD